jgi:superfamily II DNA or RNA helicase
VYNEKKTHVGLPRGNLQKIRRLLPKSRIVDRRAIPPLDFDLNVHDYVFEDERWDNQKDLVDKWLKAGGGVIKSPAASGKSVLSIVIMARMGLRTLCLFDRKDFRKQWLQELHKHTNIQDLEKEMGRTLAGIFTGQELFPITFSTFQQMLSQRSQKTDSG